MASDKKPYVEVLYEHLKTNPYSSTHHHVEDDYKVWAKIKRQHNRSLQTGNQWNTEALLKHRISKFISTHVCVVNLNLIINEDCQLIPTATTERDVNKPVAFPVRPAAKLLSAGLLKSVDLRFHV